MSSSIAENGLSCLPGDCKTGTVGFTGNEFNLRSSRRFRSSSASCFRDSRTILAFSGLASLPLMSGRDISLMDAFFLGALGTFRSLGWIAAGASDFRIVFGTSPRDRRRFFGESGPACVNETTLGGAAGALRGVFGALPPLDASSGPKSNFCLMRFDVRVDGAGGVRR